MKNENQYTIPETVEYLGRVYDLTDPGELLLYYWARW